MHSTVLHSKRGRSAQLVPPFRYKKVYEETCRRTVPNLPYGNQPPRILTWNAPVYNYCIWVLKNIIITVPARLRLRSILASHRWTSGLAFAARAGCRRAAAGCSGREVRACWVRRSGRCSDAAVAPHAIRSEPLRTGRDQQGSKRGLETGKVRGQAGLPGPLLPSLHSVSSSPRGRI